MLKRALKIVALLSLTALLALALLIIAGINRWFDPPTSSTPLSTPQLGARPSLCNAQDWLPAAAAAVTPPQPDAPMASPYWLARKAPRANDAKLNGGACLNNSRFFFAAGKSDITGVPLGQNMLGYADEHQLSAGIHTRQHARAFAIASGCSDKRLLLVALDQGLMFHSVRQGVLDQLAADAELSALYNHHNIMLSVSHSHSTAGGQAHYDLYNMTAGGHDPDSYKALVDGAVAAIQTAHKALQASIANNQPGQIKFNQAELLNTIVQRSPLAYAQNPLAERQRYLDTEGREVSVNRLMSLLRLQRDDGQNIGLLNWFAIHGTSMGQTGVLLSGDNKGHAQQLVEETYGETFIAAFMQADEGDNSPNPHIMLLSDRDTRDRHSAVFHQRGGGANDYDSTAISGYKQASHAPQLFEQATEALVGDLSARSILVDMSAIRLQTPPAGIAEARTCKPALGASFAAGAEDGRGPLREGQACEQRFATPGNDREYGLPRQPLVALGCHLPKLLDADGYGCHAEKPVFAPLTITALDPQGSQPLGPSVQTLQIVTIGNLAIIAMPWEVTTMSGRRMRETVLDALQDSGIDYAVIAGLANGDARYLTTREEYASQQYEGASTLYGPWTLAALQQEYKRLALALRSAETATSPFQVAEHRTRVTRIRDLTIETPSRGDQTEFGDVLIQPEERYDPNQKVRVTAAFSAAHPRHGLANIEGHLQIEQLQNGQWQAHAGDNDLNTRLLFSRNAIGQPQAVVEWHPLAGDAGGQYRIRFRGTSADGAYEGVSRVFQIGGCDR